MDLAAGNAEQGFQPEILKARHALAIDDERATFHPVLWMRSRQIPFQAAPAAQPTKNNYFKSGLPAYTRMWGAATRRLARQYFPCLDDGGGESGRITFKDMPDDEPDALLGTDSAKDKDGGSKFEKRAWRLLSV